MQAEMINKKTFFIPGVEIGVNPQIKSEISENLKPRPVILFTIHKISIW
jgi:hypothetical protein